MATNYGRKSLLLDNMNTLDFSKWVIHGQENGSVDISSGVLSITNDTGNASAYCGIHTAVTFPVGTSISVRSRGVQGRHHSLIGFGASPYFPFPHSGPSSGCTWYSRADNLSSTISWRNEDNTTGFYDSVTENLTEYQVFKMIRKSSSEVEFYRNSVLEYTAHNLVLSDEYSFYFTSDGFLNPNTMYIDWLSVA